MVEQLTVTRDRAKEQGTRYSLIDYKRNRATKGNKTDIENKDHGNIYKLIIKVLIFNVLLWNTNN